MTAHPDLGYRLRRAGVNDDLCDMADTLAAEVTRLRGELETVTALLRRFHEWHTRLEPDAMAYGADKDDLYSASDIGKETAAILALIPAPAKPADGPRRASGPIDPTQGFATTGAEAQWIADTEAGVYDDAAPAPPAPREGGEG